MQKWLSFLDHFTPWRLATYLAALLFTIGFGAAFEAGNIQVESPQGVGSSIVFTQLPAKGEQRARLVRLLPNGDRWVLTEGLYSARDPSLSFDGTRVLFAGKKTASSYWQVYEMQVDGSGLRQITHEAMDCRSPIYQSAFYAITSDRTWHQITFVGSVAESVPNLYSAKLDGTMVRRITHNPYGDLDPFLMPDGRVLFAGRQSNRREGDSERVALFGINLDGTDYAIFSGDEGARFKRMPSVTTSQLAVFVESDEPTPDGAGHLAAVALRRNLHSHRRLTESSDGLFHSPSPLPNGEILVSRRPSDGSTTYAIYRFDPSTAKMARVYDDPDYHDIQAKLLGPQPEPDGRSSVVNEEDPTGVLYCLNVYINDLEKRSWMPRGMVKRLRVLEGLPRPGSAAGGSQLPPATRMLGEIDVEEDGSFNIRVPANIPIQLQLLDDEGMALRSCTWIWARNRESRGCIGCHEDGELTPENLVVRAVTKPSVPLTLPPEKRRTVRFARDIQPILARKCEDSSCHDGGVRPLLRGLQDLKAQLKGAARTSPLVWQIFGRNTSRPWDGVAQSGAIEQMPPKSAAPLTEEEKRAIIEWIDLGAE
jgi:Tol biopolymer transport system component